VTERTWLLREVLRRVIAVAPLPPATWPSVVRRVLVVVAFFALGVTLGELSTTIAACFGALQVGLVEAALPFRRLARLLLALSVVCIVTVTVAMLLAGTWWAVIGIAALAYVFGSTAGISANTMTIGISSLALAVIFAGVPRAAAEVPAVAGWVALGVATQAVCWLILWKPERRWFARRAIANKLRADARMLRSATIDIPSLVRAHAESDAVAAVLRSAEFPAEQDRRLRSTFSSSIVVTRAVIAWMTIEQPGEHDRMAVGLRLEREAYRLDGWPSGRGTGTLPAPNDSGPTSQSLSSALDHLDRTIDVLDDLSATTDETPLAGPARIAASAPVPGIGFLDALRPGSATSLHGLRMAIGVGVAEAITLLVPLGHSFWLPLTVVFVLRPDWSFTLVRGVNRLLGNFAAVAALPALLLILGTSQWAMLAILIALAAVTFRWFLGNYVIASFALGGTILLLDFATNPADDVFAARFMSTVVGALIAILVLLAIPGWSRSVAPTRVEALVVALTRWRADLVRRSNDRDSVDDSALDADVADSRRAIIDLEPTVTGVLLEPGDRGHPVELAMVFASGARELAALTATTYALITLEGASADHSAEKRDSLAAQAHLASIAADLDRSVKAYRDAIGAASDDERGELY
jgi:uncharacterized membrane protein YccC